MFFLLFVRFYQYVCSPERYYTHATWDVNRMMISGRHNRVMSYVCVTYTYSMLCIFTDILCYCIHLLKARYV